MMKECVVFMDVETLKIYAYVDISRYRRDTVKTLKGEVKTPTAIARDSGIRTNHISKVLKELKEVGVAECINEDVRKGRLYRLTSTGDKIAKYMKNDENIK